MSDCLWVQYELQGSTTPYEGFINATIDCGDLNNPPPVGENRGQCAFPAGTQIDGMKIDVSAIIDGINDISALVEDV